MVCLLDLYLLISQNMSALPASCWPAPETPCIRQPQLPWPDPEGAADPVSLLQTLSLYPSFRQGSEGPFSALLLFLDPTNLHR